MSERFLNLGEGLILRKVVLFCYRGMSQPIKPLVLRISYLKAGDIFFLNTFKQIHVCTLLEVCKFLSKLLL